jgi:metal-responsive CopG/Arc/MetJ family transcriptional regulator
MPRQLIDQLDKVAAKEHKERSALIRELVTEALAARRKSS